MTPEPGLSLAGVHQLRPGERQRAGSDRGTVILLGADPGERPPELAAWHESGFSSAHLELRATGRGKPQTQAVAGVPDHDEAEWGIWLNRPLLGQWAWAMLQWIESLEMLRRDQGRLPSDAQLASPLTLFGRGPRSLVANLAAMYNDHVRAVVAERCLVSFVAPEAVPWPGVPMGIIVPNILEVADTPHLAAIVAPRRMIIASGTNTVGHTLTGELLVRAFSFTRSIYSLLGETPTLTVGVSGDLPRRL